MIGVKNLLCPGPNNDIGIIEPGVVCFLVKIGYIKIGKGVHHEKLEFGLRFHVAARIHDKLVRDSSLEV